MEPIAGSLLILNCASDKEFWQSHCAQCNNTVVVWKVWHTTLLTGIRHILYGLITSSGICTHVQETQCSCTVHNLIYINQNSMATTCADMLVSLFSLPTLFCKPLCKFWINITSTIQYLCASLLVF